MRLGRWAGVVVLGLCVTRQSAAAPFDPLQLARSLSGQVVNREAVIPVQCYTKTDGVANPCWTCHTGAQGANRADDWGLQLAYAFSPQGLKNHWANLFVDRSKNIAAISDVQALAYIRQDNYAPLRQQLAQREDYGGWRPDLDFDKGFDAEGFARDRSWWRAFRYKPFPGTFWPTNGSTDDIMIRLPWAFYTDAQGVASRETYKQNLAIVEAAVAVSDTVSDEDLKLPRHYAGAASAIEVRRYLYPPGTEFLHTVRYLDPDAPGLVARRMKEVRYSVKRSYPDRQRTDAVYREEADHRLRGVLPHFIGRVDSGLLSDFGWQLQGFIEDAQGRLRLQTTEEHTWCMGCHGNIGVTVDQSFGLPRKLPGAAGWGYQTIAGMKDVPQAGHRDPEVLTYLRRVQGGDEFRSNREMLERFFKQGQVNEFEVRRAAPGGDRDLLWLLAPSRERAIALDKAYMALVHEQSFSRGRDVMLAPPENVHREIRNGATGFDEKRNIHRDGRLWLDWGAAR